MKVRGRKKILDRMQLYIYILVLIDVKGLDFKIQCESLRLWQLNILIGLKFGALLNSSYWLKFEKIN